jgi:DNA primase
MKLTQQIKDIDLLALVRSEGIEVIQRGNNHFACCPVHSEKTPSFCMFSDGHAKCFG